MLVTPLLVAGFQPRPIRTDYQFYPVLLPRATPVLTSMYQSSVVFSSDSVIREGFGENPHASHVLPIRFTETPHAGVVDLKRNVTSVKDSLYNRETSGKASWYCKAGVSPCHYQYPPGSMVAAACGKLRAAMGPDWRGQTVSVTGNGRTVELVLRDWCGSTDKLIDLYWEPMSRLGGTGVLQVTVGW